MAKIECIDVIKISGWERYSIYAASWQIGFASQPSRFFVSFTQSGLDYVEPHLGFNTPVTITIGDRSLGIFYPIAFEESQSQREKLLKVTFVDKSALLDKILVFVRGQNGLPSGHKDPFPPYSGRKAQAGFLSNNSVIFVGQMIDICAEQEMGEDDPCDPCGDTEDDLDDAWECYEMVTCKRTRYDYSFSELIDAVNRHGVFSAAKFSAGPIGGVTTKTISFDDNYRTNYSGTLRQVLNNFCNDLGMSFYYFNNTIYFYSLRSGIPILDEWTNLIQHKERITQKSYKKTLEGTRAQMSVGYFGRDCRDSSYNCDPNGKKVTLIPIELEDVLAYPLHFDLSKPKKGADDTQKKNQYSDGFLTLKVACALRQIHPSLRDIYVWAGGKTGNGENKCYSFFEGKDLDDFIEKGEEDKEDDDESAEKNGVVLDKYYGWRAKRVFHKESKDQEYHVYNMLCSLYGGKDPRKVRKLKEGGIYFFTAELPKTNPNPVEESERSLAQGFIGQYWYRAYQQSRKDSDYSVYAPDGNAQFYKGNTMLSMPFIPLLNDMYEGVLSGDMFKLDEDDEDDEGVTGDEKQEEVTTARSMILMQRTSAWAPSRLKRGEEVKLENTIGLYIPRPFQINQQMKILIKGLDHEVDDKNENEEEETKGIPTKQDVVFVVEKTASDSGGIISLDYERHGDHPLEEGNDKIYEENKFGKQKNHVGLINIKGTVIEIKVPKADIYIEAHPPVQHFIPEKSINHDDTENDDDVKDAQNMHPAGYRALVERKDTFDIRLDKIEVYSYNGAYSIYDPFMTQSVSFIELNNDQLDLLTPAVGDKWCYYDVNKVKVLVDGFAKNFAYMNPAFEAKNYSYAGLPPIMFSPGEGITSVSFQIGSGGLVTTISYNNKPAQVLSPQVYLQSLRQNELRQYSHYSVPFGKSPPKE